VLRQQWVLLVVLRLLEGQQERVLAVPGQPGRVLQELPELVQRRLFQQSLQQQD
jgi:hypothetical protein